MHYLGSMVFLFDQSSQVRGNRGFSVRWTLAPVVDSIPQTSALNQQDLILRPWRREADVIHFGFIAVAQAVKAQTLGLRVDQSGQLCFEQSVVSGVQDAVN